MMKTLCTGLLLLFVSLPASAELNVFACEPEWAALAQEVGQDLVKTVSAITAMQDPHAIQARPSLIAGARNADLLVCTGADLEIGWLPLLLRRSGNPGIQPGSPGHFLAADHVRRIEIPASVDRAQGDVHPQGNPHIHLHPRNIERVAEALAGKLAQLDPSNADTYAANADDFLRRWSAARDSWEDRAASLAGMRLVSHHRSFSYLADWLDLDIVAALEAKPGIPPSGAQLARLLEQLANCRAEIREPVVVAEQLHGFVCGHAIASIGNLVIGGFFVFFSLVVWLGGPAAATAARIRSTASSKS